MSTSKHYNTVDMRIISNCDYAAHHVTLCPPIRNHNSRCSHILYSYSYIHIHIFIFISIQPVSVWLLQTGTWREKEQWQLHRMTSTSSSVRLCWPFSLSVYHCGCPSVGLAVGPAVSAWRWHSSWLNSISTLEGDAVKSAAAFIRESER